MYLRNRIFLKDTTIMGFIQYFIFCLLFDVQNIKALYLTNLTVPRIVDFRDKAKLSCTYEMGSHKLNSVKWYKNGLEFFRYSPMMQRPFLTFPVDGISITSRDYFCNQFICNVELNHITKNSSGAYRCEVSGDAPEFKLVGQQANMTVGVIPQYGPFINGALTMYRFGDYVTANCTSDWSMPAANLTWYINDEQAPQHFVQPEEQQSRLSDGFNLYLKTLEIRFYIDNLSILTSNGKLHLRCASDMMRLPALRKETSIRSIILSQDDLNNEKLINGGVSKINRKDVIGKFLRYTLLFTMILKCYIFLILS